MKLPWMLGFPHGALEVAMSAHEPESVQAEPRSSSLEERHEPKRVSGAVPALQAWTQDDPCLNTHDVGSLKAIGLDPPVLPGLDKAFPI
eukprot:scaffold9360_cov18-Tisochrysis_lutea.AAC.1